MSFNDFIVIYLPESPTTRTLTFSKFELISFVDSEDYLKASNYTKNEIRKKSALKKICII